jgi:hypothetical protein
VSRRWVVFAHDPSRRRGMTNTAQHRARKHWWAALDDHSQGMWVRPNVCGLFSQNVGSWPLLILLANSPHISQAGD